MDFLSGAIFVLVFDCIFFLFSLTVGISGARKMMDDPNMNPLLKWLFYASTAFTITFFMSCAVLFIVLISIADNSLQRTQLHEMLVIVSQIFGYSVYVLTMACLLANLMWRLKLTFEDSVWKMSKRVKNIFLFVFIGVILMISGIMCSYSGFVYIHASENKYLYREYNDMLSNLILVCWCVFFATYTLAAISAVYMFCRNLISLARTRSASINALNAQTTNSSQQRLVALSAKYLSLFIVAMCSTLMTLFFAVSRFGGDAASFITIFMLGFDLCNNLVCLYLQYSFAKTRYERYCKRLDFCCRKCIEARLLSTVARTYTEEVPDTSPSPVSSNNKETTI